MMLVCWVVLTGTLLIFGIEKDFARTTGGPLVWWRRWLIPLPVVLMLLSNIDGLLSLQAWLDAEPLRCFPYRYAENEAWSNHFGVRAFLSVFLIPFFLCRRLVEIFRIGSLWVLGHLLWMMFVLIPLALVTGYPFKQDRDGSPLTRMPAALAGRPLPRPDLPPATRNHT